MDISSALVLCKILCHLMVKFIFHFRCFWKFEMQMRAFIINISVLICFSVRSELLVGCWIISVYPRLPLIQFLMHCNFYCLLSNFSFLPRLITGIDIFCFFIQIANMIRFRVDSYNKPVPAILEIPSKDHPYDPTQDSVLSRVRYLFSAESIASSRYWKIGPLLGATDGSALHQSHRI